MCGRAKVQQAAASYLYTKVRRTIGVAAARAYYYYLIAVSFLLVSWWSRTGALIQSGGTPRSPRTQLLLGRSPIPNQPLSPRVGSSPLNFGDTYRAGTSCRPGVETGAPGEGTCRSRTTHRQLGCRPFHLGCNMDR